MTANEKQQALDGYAKQWTGILQEGLVKETATSVASTPGYVPGDVFTAYADGRDRVGCRVPRDLIRPDVRFPMSPSPASGGTGMRTSTTAAVDVTFDHARETDVSPSQFLQWLAGDEECRKVVNARLGSGPVKLVLGVVSARATFNRMSGGEVSLADAGHDFNPGDSKTDSSPRQYFLILYTVTRPIPPSLAKRVPPAKPTERSVAENRLAPPTSGASKIPIPVTGAASGGALATTPPQPPAAIVCDHNGLDCGSPQMPTTNGPVSPEPAVAPGSASTEAAALPVLPAGSAAATQSASLDATVPPAGGESRIPPPGTSTGAVSTAFPAGAIPAGAIDGSGLPSKSDCNGQFNRAQMLFGYSHFDRAAQAYEGAYQCAPTGEHAPLALLNLAYSYDALNRMPDMCAAIAVLYRNFHELPSSIAERAGELARMGHCRQGEPRESRAARAQP